MLRLPKQDIGTFKKQRKAKRPDTCIFYEDGGNLLNTFSKKSALCLTFCRETSLQKGVLLPSWRGRFADFSAMLQRPRQGTHKLPVPAQARHPRIAQRRTAFYQQEPNSRPPPDYSPRCVVLSTST